jgi:hemerythrin-like metal-binding protein
MKTGQGASMVPQILNELLQFVEMHFGSEERLMQSYEYPLRDMHALEHLKARRRLKELAQHTYDKTAAVQTQDELHDWLEAHIKDWDAKLSAYLRARCNLAYLPWTISKPLPQSGRVSRPA